MPPSGETTRAALIDAATRLFAEQGVDGPSTEAIVRAAGAKNASAVSYHFGSRTGLLRAVLDQHQIVIDARRRELLDEMHPWRGAPLERLARVSIDPLIEHLCVPSGPEYLRIRAELLNRGDLDTEIDQAPLIVEAAGTLDLTSVEVFAHHQRELVTTLIFAGLADYARRYPDATENDRRAYGDLLRAAMVAIGRMTPETGAR